MSAPLRVFVAAPYERRFDVRELYVQLREIGCEPVARWALNEHDENVPVAQLRADAARNDEDLGRAEAVLVLAERGKGGEMFAEVARALLSRTPVCWVGERRILSAYRDGVVLVDGVEDALSMLRIWTTLVQPRDPRIGTEHDACHAARGAIWDALTEARAKLLETGS